MYHKLLFVLAVCISCSSPEARKPLNKGTASLFTEMAQQRKKLIALENSYITRYLVKDSLQTYQVAETGFWYAYKQQSTKETPLPQTGDLVRISYNLSTLDNTMLYNSEVLGLKDYLVDKEDFIPALQDGIKLMRVGETITFIIPSYRGFGLVGDGEKIPPNQTLKSTVTLIDIKFKEKQ